MHTEFDLIVIGSGVAGAAAATKCARAGWKVAVVDELPFGGTCALRGCDPKKILRRGAEIVDAARRLRGQGIDEGTLTIDWPALIARKNAFTGQMSRRIEGGLTAAGVTTWHASASLVDTDARGTDAGGVRMNVGGREHTASHVLIATGARPVPQDFPGSEHLIDSTAFMELDALPPRILFVGGGFISFEFAHIAARAGCQATIVDRGSRPLKGFDPDLVEQLVARSASIGIKVKQGATVRGIHRAGAGFRVELVHGGGVQHIDADLVVHGAGREPNLAGLNLDAAGVAWSRRGVTVADHLQSTTNPAVYAAGDAAGDAADTRGGPFTPVAAAEGSVAAANMLAGTTTAPDYTGMPSAVFTVPELVRVGLLEQDARDAGIDIDMRRNDTAAWYSNYRVGETHAATKVLVDRATDRVIGAHLFGPGYAELANIIALGIMLGLTTGQLNSATATYPSVGTDLQYLL